MNIPHAPKQNIVTVNLNDEEMAQVMELCSKLRSKPSEVLHVVCTGTINDYLSDERLAATLLKEIAARFDG